MPHSVCIYILCDSANKDIDWLKIDSAFRVLGSILIVLKQKVQLKLKAAIKECNYVNLTH